MRRNLMSLIMHPLHNPRIVVDITKILPVNKERTPDPVSTKQVKELRSVLVWSVVESKCNCSGGRTSIDDRTNRNSRVGRGAGRSLSYGHRCSSSDRCSKEGIGASYHVVEGYHLEACTIKNG